MKSCDCLNACGDDSNVEGGGALPCERYRAWTARARIVGVSRNAEDPRVLIVHYSDEPTDDDIRALHNFERWPSP
jgi:hypothetical protein